MKKIFYRPLKAVFPQAARLLTAYLLASCLFPAIMPLAAETNALPTEANGISTEAASLPTEANGISTEAASLPTEANGISTEATSLPTETDAILMGADGLPLEVEHPFLEYDISLMAIGDNLLHMGIVRTGQQPDGSYNYDFLFEGINRFLEKSDIKMINQETIFGGNELGFHGFPKFNSPVEVSDAIAKAGFNVVMQATNHTADQGIKGMQNCLDVWKTKPEVLVSGLHEPYNDENAQSRIPILEIEGRTFAILNYTYGPNSESISRDTAEMLNMLCAVDEKSRRIDFKAINPQVLADIAEADKLADVVIVSPHWGNEHATVPSVYQKTFAQQMTEAGADVIIGTHPHVVQPVEWIEAPNGNRAICYYSIGNYVSTQQKGQNMLEGLAWVTFHVSEDSISIVPENTGVIPLVCHYSHAPTRLKQVYALEEYTEELARAHGIIPYGGISFHLSDLQKWSDEILGGSVLPVDIINRPHCARLK